VEICSGTYMLSEGKIRCKEGSDGSYVFPVIIEEIRLLRVNIFLKKIVILLRLISVQNRKDRYKKDRKCFVEKIKAET